MEGLAANDAPERDRTIIGPPRRRRRVDRDREAGWNLQGAVDVHSVVCRSRRLQGACRAVEEESANRIVVARLDDQKSSAVNAWRRYGAAWPGHGVRSSVVSGADCRPSLRSAP